MAPESPTPSFLPLELTTLLEKQAEEIRKLRSDLMSEVKRQALNNIRQLEAFHALQALVGDIPADFHGWPISPDFALGLVRLIRDGHYHLVVEFGSGTSTFLQLRALEIFGDTRVNYTNAAPKVLTYENNCLFLAKTEALVRPCINRVDLDLALRPLTPWADCTGAYSYYSGLERIREVLELLQLYIGDLPLNLLVVIDGPPGATCHWARYPAVPVVLDACNGLDVRVDFFIDDMIRPEETEMAEAWEQIFCLLGLGYERVDYGYEKGGLLLHLPSIVGVDTSQGRRAELEQQRLEQSEIAAAIIQVDELGSELSDTKPQVAEQLRLIHRSHDELANKLRDLEAELSKKTMECEIFASSNAAAAMRAEKRSQQLEAQLRQALQPQQEWQSSLEQEQYELNLQRELFNAEREAHARDLRELDVLRAECARRFALLHRSDQLQLEQANQLKALQHELAELHQQLSQVRQTHDLENLRLQASERDGEEHRRDLATRSADAAAPAASSELRVFEQQLLEARNETEFLQHQLHQAQEELEHYSLLLLNNRLAAAPVQQQQQQPVHQADTDAINAFRQRLLASR